MLKIDKDVITICENISSNIDKIEDNVGLLSQNVLSQLRNLVEAIISRVYIRDNSLSDDRVKYLENIKPGIKYIKGIAKYKFLYDFHNSLDISGSHYTLDYDGSERLIYKYLENLIKIRNFLKKEFNLKVLENLNKFPLNKDNDLYEYYFLISEEIDKSADGSKDYHFGERYYIQKKKPFFIEGKIYYELSVVEATDKYNKFDRFIFYTKVDINPYYAIKIKGHRTSICHRDLFIPIVIVSEYQVAIRPCEINNFSRILDIQGSININYKDYRFITDYLTENNYSLVDIIRFDNLKFQEVIKSIEEVAQSKMIINILTQCKKVIDGDYKGQNILKLLLLRLNNVMIKNQCKNGYAFVDNNPKLSNLKLHYGCLPFEEMPFCSSPIGTNIPLSDLFEIIDISGREHELLARYLVMNAERGKQIYTSIDEIKKLGNISELIWRYNNKLYKDHQGRRIEVYKDKLYIKSYDENVAFIIKHLLNLTEEGLLNYTNSVLSWLKLNNYEIDCPQKKQAFEDAFDNTKVFAVYGSAGTGKTKLLEHFAFLFSSNNKVFLSNTYASLENLKRRIKIDNSVFYSVQKYLHNKNISKTCDVLILDECSTISNEDMRLILEISEFKLLILAGDPFQIESITFGNWFETVERFLPPKSHIFLKTPFRTKNKELINVWEKVRNFDSNILEYLTMGGYCSPINKDILLKNTDDEIILCLNYDGLYGINNVNRLLQQINPNKSHVIGVNEYKIGDPILFNENCEKYEPLLYNNAKGIINDIFVENGIQKFRIELDKSINELNLVYGVKLVGTSESKNSIIELSLAEKMSSDDDDAISNVPFNVSYAISIHKSQGLEYDSVKIIIVDEIEELITHNIFYTAITRTKNLLKIFWSPKTQEKVLSGFQKDKNIADAKIISVKHGIDLNLT